MKDSKGGNYKTFLVENKLARKIYLILTGLWFFSMSPILNSSWAGDDWPNSQTPYWLEWRYGSSSIANTLREALYWNHAWMFGQGRFYLMHWIESRITFVYLREILEYKFFQYFILCFCGLLFVYLVRLLSDSQILPILTLGLLSLTVQIRSGFDPHLAFAGMVPSMLIKVFLAAILVFKATQCISNRKRQFLTVCGGIMYFLAMSTYEFSFFLFPLLLISYQLGSEKMLNRNTHKSFLKWIDRLILGIFEKNFRPILFSWLSYGFLIFGVLRNLAKDISGSYELGLSLDSIGVFISQIFTGIPLVSFFFNDSASDLFLENQLWFLLLSIFLFTLVLYVYNKVFTKDNFTYSGKLFLSNVEKSLFLIGAVMIITPGLMMSFQKSWWERASIELSYLGVLITEFGTALVLAILLANSFIGKFSRKKVNSKVLND